MHLEPAFENDLELPLALSWRNDLDAQKYSFRNHPLSFEEFKENLFGSNACPLWIKQNDRPIGMISFHGNEMSLFLDPHQRGMGLGAQAISKGLEWAYSGHKAHVLAYIKKEHRASQKAFERAGFKCFGIKQLEKHNQSFEALEYKAFNPQKMKTFVIAEIGSNYKVGTFDEDLRQGRALILAARRAGASAVKFQHYDSSSVYAKGAGSPAYLQQDIHEVFDSYALGFERLKAFYEYASHLGIEFMCSAFSRRHFEEVDPWVKRHKIASYEIRHIELLQAAAAANKPLLLSTGASELEDIEWAINTFKKYGGRELTLLHCNAQYPADPNGLHLRCIQTLKDYFKCPVGFSDHSGDPVLAPTLACALGASVIEKHVTLSRGLRGPDHFFALEVPELELMIQKIKETESMLGVAKKEIFAQEEELAAFARRALHALGPIKKGEPFVLGENIGILRSGTQKPGAHPKYLEQLLKARAQRDFAAGEGISEREIMHENRLSRDHSPAG